MWPGPYGQGGGSRKYVLASLDQSLKRLGLDYVDIFYHHRPDPETPLEETMAALAHIVSSGRALYVGLSNYPAERMREAAALLRQLGTPCVIHQPRYSMLDRWIEPALLPALADEGIGCIAFSPLAQGLLTNRYLNGIPEDSRMAKGAFLKKEALTDETLQKIKALNEVAASRGQTLAEMSLAWLLKDDLVTSVIIGASSVAQLADNLKATENTDFSAEELEKIKKIIQK